MAHLQLSCTVCFLNTYCEKFWTCAEGERMLWRTQVPLSKFLVLRTGCRPRAARGPGVGSQRAPVECGVWSVGPSGARSQREGRVCSAHCALCPQTAPGLSSGLPLWRLLSLSYLGIFDCSYGKFHMSLTLLFFPPHWFSSPFSPRPLPWVQALHFGCPSTAQSRALWLCVLHS